ncbi:hypothetical protein J2W34_000765 [Variovorax boronicumulans]|uniref:hypothetical protein n=1 Tax=Variovorax boronicumulans TaxID=436515 RepID=UPI002783C236|nr:hypothetical protein [Variovorax boronicumulans]MDQ0068991.1 hypothetical protein [Variovorax boronicumulans]
MRSTSFQETGVGLVRTSPVRPIPGLLATAAALAVFIVLPIVLAAMCVYGWSTP